MADSTLNETISEGRAAALIRRPPPALRIAVIYLVARAITTGFLAIAAALSGPSSRFGADATLGSLSMGWDGQWYWYVAVNGYPATLPLNDAGDVAQNQWAFMPLYPWIANAIGAPIGQYAVGAILVSLVAGYLACLVLYRLLRTHIDDVAATWAIVFFAAGPLAALFQLGYAESLFLLWLFLSLWCVSRRRFAWLYLLIPLMGFTRPGVLAFALFLGLYGIWRWVVRRRDPLPVRQIVHIVALGLLAVIVGFSWQVIAGAVTGDPSAYLTTELSWRRDWLGAGSAGFVPFEGFINASAMWFRLWGLPPWLGYIALTASVLLLAYLLIFDRRVRALGPEVRLWSASYLIYLLAVFFPQSSLFRLLLPLSPLWGAAAVPRSRAWRIGVLAVCLAGQWWWIYSMFALGNTYTQIP